MSPKNFFGLPTVNCFRGVIPGDNGHGLIVDNDRITDVSEQICLIAKFLF